MPAEASCETTRRLILYLPAVEAIINSCETKTINFPKTQILLPGPGEEYEFSAVRSYVYNSSILVQRAHCTSRMGQGSQSNYSDKNTAHMSVLWKHKPAMLPPSTLSVMREDFCMFAQVVALISGLAIF